ncbi:LOW QUALITY PROTEIN: hypothetical protein ElyMa_003246300 [Elysia marginata]|uniref:Uncharacterized protein n=1 Tax=Elysia marginata TaxID=1093978 RepID=A0AAV4J5R4_9GAST|nr:LOW QUALITY PROTEIN: hypothetical protein ElyMa_003246300 [Elysia marginata]
MIEGQNSYKSGTNSKTTTTRRGARSSFIHPSCSYDPRKILDHNLSSIGGDDDYNDDDDDDDDSDDDDDDDDDDHDGDFHDEDDDDDSDSDTDDDDDDDDD